MEPIIIDYSKYPFLADLDEVLRYRWPGLRLYDIVKNVDSYPARRAMEIFKALITRKKMPSPRSTGEDEVLAFYTLATIVKLLKDKKLLSILSVRYSKLAYESFRNEDVKTLVKIGNIMGLKTDLPREYPLIPLSIQRGRPIYSPRPIRIHFKDYLTHTAKRLARDPKYALVNQIADKGFIYLDKEVFSRILEEVVQKRIHEIVEKLEPDENLYRDILEKYRKILEETGWASRRLLDEELERSTAGVIDFSSFPPCMKLLLDRLKSGENLGHQERFAIAAFLARIGLSVDSILEFFKHAPDFNEKIARYQIEHIAGLKGSRKKYLPYSCETMKAMNICPITGQCKGGKNPLAVYKYNVKIKKLREKQKNS